jgi:hypothetical protein
VPSLASQVRCRAAAVRAGSNSPYRRVLGGRQLSGLGDQGGLVEAGVAAERADDLGVQAPLADAGLGR